MDNTLVHTILIWSGIGILFFGLTMLAVSDVLRKEFSSIKIKVLWGLIALFPFVGWVIYLLFGFRQGKVPVQDDLH
ncbi:MAG: PLDc N-terminal domain-containing protein [Proteobacteria bacterium]|nr:PLDc N-terminal domain-containing protein [Pseudomonadota bacterium]